VLAVSLTWSILVFPGRTLLADENRPQSQKNWTADKGQETQNKEKKKKSEDEKKEKIQDIEVEVVAKRIPQPSFKTDRSVSLFHEEMMIEQLPRTIPEALFETPGTFVQHTNYGGGSPIVRGMIGPQNLLMVDGIRFNNSTYRTGPGQYLNLIDSLSAERIEILRGPGSVLYGSDAMGGVIQVMTLTPLDRRDQRGWGLGGKFLTRFGSADNSRVVNGRFDAGRDNFSLLGGVSYKKFDDLKGGKGVGVQPYVGYDQFSAIGKGVYRILDGSFAGWAVVFGYLFTRLDDAGRTDKLYDANSLQIYDNDDHLLYGRLHMEYPSLNAQGDLILSYQDFFERKDNHKVEDDYTTIRNSVRDSVSAGTWGLDLNMTSLLNDRLHMNYGGMWYRDSVDAGRWRRIAGEDWIATPDQSYPDGSTYANSGAYMMMGWEPFRLMGQSRFLISGGYRLHNMSAKVPSKGDLPAVDFSHTGNVFTLSTQYLYGEVSNIALTFSQGFRSPNLQESVMLGDTGKFFHIPNCSLKPERSDTIELIVRRSFGRMIIVWSGYTSFLKDLIKREGTL